MSSNMSIKHRCNILRETMPAVLSDRARSVGPGCSRTEINDKIEQTLAGKKSAAAALDSAVQRGNVLLRQFERANR